MSATTAEGFTGPWTEPRAQRTVATRFHDDVTMTLVGPERCLEGVAIETRGVLKMFLLPVEAADVAEALMKVSGMASTSYTARFLSRTVREGMEREGVTRARVIEQTGITRYRLRKILSGETPMTQVELEAICEVRATTPA